MAESGTRRVGFRALKKTLEAPYTTKVNNRVRTSRGTTPELSGHGKFDTVKSALNSEFWHGTQSKDTQPTRWLLSLVGNRVGRRR